MRVKICGLTRAEDVKAAVAAGATAIGFVFAESPRQISLETARELVQHVPDEVEVVAVFRKPDPAFVQTLINTVRVDGIQADADWPHANTLPRHVFFLPVFKDGVGLTKEVGKNPGATLAYDSLMGSILVDGPKGGGQGIASDWARVAEVSKIRPVILAGGLNPENVAEAVRIVMPAGVDVSSGVEMAPGLKDPEKIVAFIDAARGAFR